jgi:hypothetical protein
MSDQVKKPVKGQLTHYDYGFSHYTGEVVELYDDCYIVKGPHIRKVRVTYYDNFFNTSITPSKMNLLYKDGQPVMKKRWFQLV